MSGWWKYAYVGQKVVRVRVGLWSHGDPDCGDPIGIGEVVTIKSIDVNVSVSCGVILWFGHETGRMQLWYGATQFKPATPKSTETGMAMIRKILDQVPVKETVDG